MRVTHGSSSPTFLSDLRRSVLEVHPDRSRLIEFGHRAARSRKDGGDGKPRVRFPGLHEHLLEVQERPVLAQAQDHLEADAGQACRGQGPTQAAPALPIPEQGAWLGSVARGHLGYYAVPGNTDAVSAFRTQVTRLWFTSLRRRSQRSRVTWTRMNRYATYWLAPARMQNPFPSMRLDARTRGRSPCVRSARWDLCGDRRKGQSVPQTLLQPTGMI
jgi:RNA-directed DNA polymerase